MTDRDRTDRDAERRDKIRSELDAELRALGEEAAAEDEHATAARLAARLEGAPQEVGDDEAELASLTALTASLGATGGAASKAGEAATFRAMEAIFGPASAADAPEGVPQGSTSHTTSDVAEDAPSNALEEQRAKRLAEATDRLLAGVPETLRPRSEDEASLVNTAAELRYSAHARSLTPRRMGELVNEALGSRAARPRHRGARVLMGLGLVSALAASLFIVAFLWTGSPPSPREVPTHLSSRSTRDILPGPFPRHQSESERIDLIYHHRLQAYRELGLGALSEEPERLAARGGTWATRLASLSLMATRAGGGTP